MSDVSVATTRSIASYFRVMMACERCASARAAIVSYVMKRLFEVVMTMIMLSMVPIFILSPDTIKIGSFRLMHRAGFDAFNLAIFFAVFGTIRIAAFIANGNWKVWGPRFRAIGAGAAAFIWFQMAYALLILSPQTGTLSVGIPVYFWLMVGEVVSCYRAAADGRTCLSNP